MFITGFNTRTYNKLHEMHVKYLFVIIQRSVLVFIYWKLHEGIVVKAGI